MSKAEGKVAVVTGANRGIGRGLTEALAERGATVLMVCRDETAGAQAEDELRARDLDVRLLVADMESTDDIQRIGREVRDLFPRVDILVNCAAVNLDAEHPPIEDLDLDTLMCTLRTDFIGPVWMCREFVPLLRKSKSGRVVNFTSGLGRLTIDHPGSYLCYSMSKVAINGLTKLLAAQLRDTKVMVFSVDPGWVRTGLGGPNAPLPLEKGVETPLWLATAPADQLQSGCLYHDKKVVSW